MQGMNDLVIPFMSGEVQGKHFFFLWRLANESNTDNATRLSPPQSFCLTFARRRRTGWTRPHHHATSSSMLKRIVIGVFAKFLTTFRKITHLLSLVFRKHVSTSARCVESTGSVQQTFVIS